MRRFAAAFVLIGSIVQAHAGDFDIPTLRGSDMVVPGPASYTRWTGFYAGGQVSYSSSNFDFSNASSDLLAFVLRNLALETEQAPSQWQVLGSDKNQTSGYGAFVGYNTQWDEAVVGLELNYSRVSLDAVAPVFPIARVTTADSNTYLVSLNAAANMSIKDYMTTRARFGWAYGNLLPYAAIGFAVGRASYFRSATAAGTETTPSGVVTPFSFTSSDSKSDAFIYGWSAAVGVDVDILPNAFVRAEAEYTQFAPIGNIQSNFVTGRLGAGLRF